MKISLGKTILRVDLATPILNNGWHAISDVLPKIRHSVILRMENGTFTVGKRVAFGKHPNQWNWSCAGVFTPKKASITHWREIPEFIR